MNQGGRVFLLGTAVVLLVVGVVCLKKRLGGIHAPAAFLKAEDTAPKEMPVQDQPTILSADPNSAQPLAPSWHDARMLPLHPQVVEPLPTYPVTSGSAPFEVTPQAPPLPSDYDEPRFPPPEDSTFSSEPNGISRESSTASTPPRTIPEFLASVTPSTNVPNSLEQSESLPEAVTPVAPAFVITEKDDSLWQIAERVYGEGRFFRALFAVNRSRLSRPDRIHAGIELLTPTVDELRQLYPDLCPLESDARGTS